MMTSRLSLYLLLLTVRIASAAPPGAMPFDTDPGWESFRSRLMPEPRPVVRQQFGYREKSRLAGGAKAGEIGGWVQRSMNPASYAKVIPPRTFEQKLTASGTFCVAKNHGGSGVLFGWFNEVGSSRVDLQACKLEYSIVSPK